MFHRWVFCRVDSLWNCNTTGKQKRNNSLQLLETQVGKYIFSVSPSLDDINYIPSSVSLLSWADPVIASPAFSSSTPSFPKADSHRRQTTNDIVVLRRVPRSRQVIPSFTSAPLPDNLSLSERQSWRKQRRYSLFIVAVCKSATSARRLHSPSGRGVNVL
jgi:hypothetical protein